MWLISQWTADHALWNLHPNTGYAYIYTYMSENLPFHVAPALPNTNGYIVGQESSGTWLKLHKNLIIKTGVMKEKMIGKAYMVNQPVL